MNDQCSYRTSTAMPYPHDDYSPKHAAATRKEDTSMVLSSSSTGQEPNTTAASTRAPFTQCYDALLPYFSGNELKIYWTVKSHDRGRGAWPTQATIARKSCLDVRTVRRALKAFVAAGAMSRTKQGRGKPDKYWFPPIPAGWSPAGGNHRCTSDTAPQDRTPVSTQDRVLASTQDRTPMSAIRIRTEERDTKPEGDSGLDWTTASGGSPRCNGEHTTVGPEDVRSSTANVDGSSQRNLGYNDPLASETERLAIDLVTLLDTLRTETLCSSMTERQRRDNLKTARLLLAHDRRSHREVTRLLRWAYDDIHWRSRVTTLFQLRASYVELFDEARTRRPRRFKPRTEPHGQTYTPGTDRTDGPKKSSGFGLATRL